MNEGTRIVGSRQINIPENASVIRGFLPICFAEEPDRLPVTRDAGVAVVVSSKIRRYAVAEKSRPADRRVGIVVVDAAVTDAVDCKIHNGAADGVPVDLA